MHAELIASFYAGLLFQAVFLLYGQLTSKDALTALAVCAGSLLGFIPGKHEHQYDLSFHLLFVAGLFALIYTSCFREKLLERINKEILMIWTLVGLYVACGFSFIVSNPYFYWPLIGLSLLAVANAFAHFDRSHGWRVFFYIWFLCLVVGVAASQFGFSGLAAVFGLFKAGEEEINAFAAFVIGLSFLYLAVNCWYLLQLIPLPGKHQSFGERLDEIKTAMDRFAEDYDAAAARRWRTLVLFIVCASLLTANFFRHFVSDTLLIPLLLASLPVLQKVNFSKTATAAAGSGRTFEPQG